jgi:predicted ATPase
VTLLTTSREALRLQAEHRYELDPLEVPVSDDPAEIAEAPAAALFLARARSQGGPIELDPAAAAAVAEICGRLDGLPLALELAAARSSLLGLAELCDRLGRAVDVLGSGSRDLPDRQRTLRATIEWSHDLLVPPEREAFARFAVFAGGASVATAEQVTGAGLDTLGALVDKNLLLRRDGPGGQSRLAMLETVREFAAERLEASDDAGALRALHCRHYLGLAERADPELYTKHESEWLPRLDAEVENLRAALAWGIEHAPADALRLAGALSTYWSRRNLLSDWAEWSEAALRAAGPAAPTVVRANALLGQAWHMTSAGSLFDRTRAARTRELAASALALFQEASDPSGSGWALIALSWSLYNEALPHDDRLALVDDALGYAELSADPRLRAMCLAERAIATPPRRAEEPIAAAARALREVGDIWTLSTLYWYGAHAAIRSGATELAAGLIERALSHAPELDDPHEMTAEPPLEGYLALFLDDDEHAQRAFEDQLRFCQARAVVYLAPPSLAGLAALAARRGDEERGAQLLGAAESIGPVETVEVLAQLEERFFAPARKRLGEASWARAHADGAELGLDDALGLAEAPRRSHGAGLSQ